MATQQTEKLRDCAVIMVIHLFGASYFVLFVLHLFLFHFPSTPNAILNSIAVLFFCASVIFWCISSLLYRTISAATQCSTTGWQNLEFIGTLVLISATTVPFVVLQFAAQPSVQLSYLSALTLVTVGFLVDLVAVDPNGPVIRERFPFHCASLGLLMLIPVIHALSEGPFSFSPLAFQFGKVATCNTLVAILFLIRPLERMRVITGWRPSLYAMHLVLVYSAMTYSRDILHVMIDS
jgi:predicted membrane channel-forming protein YqfA (hemolysin III family)